MPLLINYSAAHYDNHDAFVTELQAYFMFALWPASVQYFPLKYKGFRLLLIWSVPVKVLPGAKASVYKPQYVTTAVWSAHTGWLSDTSTEISTRKWNRSLRPCLDTKDTEYEPMGGFCGHDKDTEKFLKIQIVWEDWPCRQGSNYRSFQALYTDFICRIKQSAWSWKWKVCHPSKRQQLVTSQDGLTSLNGWIFSCAAVRNWNLAANFWTRWLQQLWSISRNTWRKGHIWET